MKISDLLRLSTDNLRRRKGRTALTIIGVVVGTCAIVVMISLGIATNVNNETMLASWGDLTQIQIYNYAYGATETPALNDEMLNQIRSLDHVVAVTPYYQPSDLNGKILSGKNGRYETGVWQCYGADPDALEKMGFNLADGSFFTSDMSLGKNKIPVMVGENFAYNFEDTRKSYNSGKRQISQGQTDANGNPVQPFVDVNKDKMTLHLSYTDNNGKEKTQDYDLVVVGTFVSDYSKHYFTDSGMVMRLSDMKMLEEAYQKLSGTKKRQSQSYMISNGVMMKEKDNGYQEVYVKVDEVDNVSDVESWIKDQGYQTYSMTQIREDMQAQVAKSQMILGGTAAVALLVAALNIANTMTMAIYERTKEIGVMKVLGCELNNIRTMFLFEAGAIGLLGGIVGVAFSYLLSFILNNVSSMMMSGDGMSSGMLDAFGSLGASGGQISIIPLWLVLAALAFSTLVGLVSGVVPANRAVKISALEAIRRE